MLALYVVNVDEQGTGAHQTPQVADADSGQSSGYKPSDDVPVKEVEGDTDDTGSSPPQWTDCEQAHLDMLQRVNGSNSVVKMDTDIQATLEAKKAKYEAYIQKNGATAIVLNDTFLTSRL